MGRNTYSVSIKNLKNMGKILEFIYKAIFYGIASIASIAETIIKIISFALFIPAMFSCMIISIITRKMPPTWMQNWYAYCEKFSDYKSIKYLMEIFGN